MIQESLLLFQNNPDLVPYTKEFDKELADRFADIAGDYELRIDGKLYGYQVNVQPLINRLRKELDTKRGAQGATARQQQAAQQARDEAGRFEPPQAGIPPKAPSQAPEEEDYETFWGATGFGRPRNMII